MRTTVTLAAAAIVATAGLTGCSSTDSREASAPAASSVAADTSAATGGAPAAAVADTARPGGAAAPAGQASRATATSSPGRSVITRTTLTMEADDVAATTSRARALAAEHGGRVDDEQTGSPDDGERTRSTLVLRVPAERLEKAVAALGSLGTVTDRRTSREDVTEQVVDLDARRASLRTSIGRLRGLLDTAGSLADVTAVEKELAAREGELQSLEARLAAVRGDVTLSTVRLTIAPRPVPLAAGSPGFGGGLSRGVDTLTAAAAHGTAVIGFVLPWAAVAAPVVAAALLLLRRRSATART